MSPAVHNIGGCRVCVRLLIAAFFISLLCIILPIAFHNNTDNRSSFNRLDYLGMFTAAPRRLSVAIPLNFTSTLISRWQSPALLPCQSSHTVSISIPAFDGLKSPVDLPAGVIHEFLINTFDESNHSRCSGGDFFELDLSGDSWKSRPPVTDHANGSYTVRMQVDPAFIGNYNFSIILLFRSFDWLRWQDGSFAFRKEMRKITVRFYDDGTTLPRIKECREQDFDQGVWSGRWTRLANNDTCEFDNDGRYRCLDPGTQCRGPWCEGTLAALESNGWVYSAHCSFKIFTQDSAWKCLANKWLFFWGDSNHVDTIRNFLNFVLGLTEIDRVPRRFDDKFVNPMNESQSVRITSIFNGHWNESMNYIGLQSLTNARFRKLIWKYFSKERFPDAMILNSGLHDGKKWDNIRQFAEAAEYAASFWGEILRHVAGTESGTRPAVFYRSTIATAGRAREQVFNPGKMEAYNEILIEKLMEKGVLVNGGVIDEFDMSFPWHYDHRCSDGIHYGRRPERKMWRDGEVGHHYFVDLMLCHVLLNAICNG